MSSTDAPLLRQQWRAARHAEIAAFAAEMADTYLDIDPDVESAASVYVLKTTPEPG
jgi:hypothetical protein